MFKYYTVFLRHPKSPFSPFLKSRLATSSIVLIRSLTIFNAIKSFMSTVLHNSMWGFVHKEHWKRKWGKGSPRQGYQIHTSAFNFGECDWLGTKYANINQSDSNYCTL